MSGFEIVGAVAAGLQVAQQGVQIVAWIRNKVRDEKSLRQLETDCNSTINLLESCLADLSPGGHAAARRLRDRLKIIIQNIDKVSKMKWWDKFKNLMRIWSSEFVKQLETATYEFRNVIVLEANTLLQSIKLQQGNLELSFREKVDDVIQQVDEMDVIIRLVQRELSDLDISSKLVCIEQLGKDLSQRLESLHIAEEAANTLVQSVSEGVCRIEIGVVQTNLKLEEQQRLLQEIKSTVAVGFQNITSEAIEAVPRSPSLQGPIFTYREYSNFILRNNIYLPEVEIWDAIRDFNLAIIELYEMGYYFSKHPGMTNLDIGYKGRNYTYWANKLGECKPLDFSRF